MRRALLIGGVTLALSGCGLRLEDFPVAFACDHRGGDGGRQCADDWRCGLADRCFYRDAGDETLALDWSCEADAQCPDGWRCGVEVDGLRRCQQLGVGAPSPCRTSVDCQGGWQCALAQKCFDPSLTDGGADVVCGADENCPMGFRCGQELDHVRRCLAVGVGAPSPCLDDLGCEGGWRCDTEHDVCVEVPDTLDAGHLDALGAEVLNRTQPWPVPLKIAMSRRSTLPKDGNPVAIGAMTASLFDGGVLFSRQWAENGFGAAVDDVWVPMPAGRSGAEVTELVVTPDGPAVRWASRAVHVLRLDGGVVALTADAELLRPWNATYGLNVATAMWASGPRVSFIDGGGFTLPGAVQELVSLSDDTFAFTDAGLYRVHFSLPAELVSTQPLAGRALDVAVGALPRQTELNLVALVALPDGGTGIQAWLPAGDAGLYAALPEPSPACPSGFSAISLAFASRQETSDLYAGALARCMRPDGGSFSMVTWISEQQGRLGARTSPATEDQVPWTWPFAVQTHSPLTRVVAGSERRLWNAIDPNDRRGDEDGYSVLGNQPLRPLLLDRTPKAIVAWRNPLTNTTILSAAANARMYFPTHLGLMSNHNIADSLVPYALFANSPDWVISNLGVLDVNATLAIGTPSMAAVPPAGTALDSPAQGLTAVMMLGGQPRTVMLVASGEEVLVADVTENVASVFSPPAQLTTAIAMGSPLTSFTLEGSTTTPTAVLTGYLTTPSQTVRFRTGDLVHWALDAIPFPAGTYPVKAWSDEGRARVATGDGRVWTLPLPVALSRSFADAGIALDFAVHCGDVFATSSELGLLQIRPVDDGGLPEWRAVDALNREFTASRAASLFPTVSGLIVGGAEGRLVRLTPTRCP
ncbi:MAG: hypothetical protein ACOZQL_00700 [Myxococcota bacterium]